MCLLDSDTFNFDFWGMNDLVFSFVFVCVCEQHWCASLFGFSLELHFVYVSAHVILVQNVSGLSLDFSVSN